MAERRQYDRAYDLHAWTLARLGVRNLDGGRGYEQGVRIVSCPLCDDATLDRGRGWVNVLRKTAGCFNAGCPAEGGMLALEYVRRVEGYRTKTDALGMLLQEFPSLVMPSVLRPRFTTYNDWCELPPSTAITMHPGKRPSVLYDEVRAFLKRQWGLTTLDAEHWGLRYCIQGYHAMRIIIPVVMGGVLVGFQTRAFRGADPKYLTSHQGERGEPYAECGRPAEAMLYNIDAVQEGDDVILVEGVGDAMAYDKVKSPGEVPVAILGLALTDEKMLFLGEKQPGRVIIATDAEPDAQQRGRRMLDDLSSWGIPILMGRWVGGKDAGAGAELHVKANEDLEQFSLAARERMHR